MDRFIEFRSKENIRPVTIPNKEKYYYDLENIENSWSGRADVWSIGNTFVMEAEQLLINSLELFEMGYFDCAYYSLRSAVDVSTTIVFLADMPETERERYLSKWKATEDFPMQRQMLKMLATDGDAFIDMKQQMPLFFSDAKTLSAELNKYVHKQGFQHFYVSKNHPINAHKSLDSFIADFECYFKKCTGVVAVMRLAIDPFPVLLMDEEILYRCYDSMTDPYSAEFVDEYIGVETLSAYKNTARYTGMYNYFMAIDKKNEHVFNVVKHQYINATEKQAILNQAHLMTAHDVISVLLTTSCNKIAKVYISNSLLCYFTERKTNRTSMSWSSADFDGFSKSASPLNQVYDEVFISAFPFGEEVYLMEHNTQLDDEDVGCIRNAFEEFSLYFDTVLSDD